VTAGGVVEKLMKRNPIATPFGRLSGRDCLRLDGFEFDSRDSSLTLHGDLNGDLCEHSRSGVLLPYVLTFRRVVAMRVQELDSWRDQPASSFDEVDGSTWLGALAGEVGERHRHFVVQTYDEVFDVACEQFEFVVDAGNPVSGALRSRVLLSLQRALVGGITPEIQAVATSISRAEIRILLFLGDTTPSEVRDEFDADVVTQVVADFCWPERGDPTVLLDSVFASAGAPLSVPESYILVFARSDCMFVQQ
jgi:hypothetical protein